MDYKEKFRSNSLTIYASGRWTFTDHLIMKQIVENIITYKNIIIDMNDLDFMGSAALGMLLIINERLKDVDGSFVVTNPKGQVKRILIVTRMNEVMKIEGLQKNDNDVG